ncbi:hypothetical protein NA56DRAFT_658472 [Hyaloscypha hepaticicola]|uniref:DNA/RNA-binding domain-containing protein n=1 Tax=Hyaloscypha hepaticicola TaxID=2082293 RepID=A0A2J6Q6U1_9HELO|nr:hypothetical protein NA56DRAFT_658472 [Hyaloscypha hepaticicola]
MSSSKSNQDLDDLWIQHQRKNTKTTQTWACISCPDRRIFATEPALWEHATADHGEQISARKGDLQDIREQYAAESAQKKPEKDSSQPRKTNLNAANRAQPEVVADRDEITRSSRPQNTQRRQLWQDGQAPLIKSSFENPSHIASIAVQKARAQQGCPSKTRAPSQALPPSYHSPRLATTQSSGKEPENYDIVLQPETRPISQEQLVAEVKGIYAGLVMVEAKCIEVDNKQASLAQADPSAQPKLNNEQWQALIALHRTLLHEHHDFFLASQHPSASAALRRLASKYAMPARMWRHGIHSFLELLRHKLPASLDHMLAFIYLAYSMMALLYETVPAFEDTWIECLGDLGRYRMAIEDDDIRDREVWTGVARHWYSKASDKAPTTGRLYHHLAILARPNSLQQLFYYAKSLCVVIPFTSTRESILTLFDPVLNAENYQGQYRLPPLDTSFVKAHGLLFTNKNMERFDSTNQTLPRQDSGSRLNSTEELSLLHRKLGKLSSILHRLPMRRSGSLTSVFRVFQRFKRVMGASVFLGQLGLVEASCTEKAQSATTNLWRPTALATTILVCCLSMRAAKKKWNLDLLLAANIVTPLACMYVAVDNEFSDHELFILWLYGAGLDFMWLKDKILKYPRSAGVVALLLPTVGVLSASQFVHKVPALQSRFDDQVLPIAILSFPTTVFCSLMWVAIGRTGFAEDLENGEYNPHIFGFIKYVFDTLVLSMIQQLIRNFTAYFLGQNVPNIGSETLRRQQHDLEADRPGDEVFRGRSPYRPARGERSSSEWSPDHY